MSHSKIVGGSTAKRLINCPGSRALVETVPEKPTSSYAEEGTRLHNAMHAILSLGSDVEEFDNNGKLRFALDALNEIDPNRDMEYQTEVTVHFGGFLAGVFGSCDLLGRVGRRAVLLDWKFGDGVAVDAVENDQLLFYAAAALRTAETQWAFANVAEVELIIVQPPRVSRWVTSLARVKEFERALFDAVQMSYKPDAPFSQGEHCRWCPAKAVCPAVTGKLERAVATKAKAIDAEKISHALEMAALAEDWAKSVRELAQTMLENDAPVAGWKLVPKRATRQWSDVDAARITLTKMGLDDSELMVLKSPAQVEKIAGKLPKDLTVAISTGNTIAPADDPRPAVVTHGNDLIRAFSNVR